jgi:hypothetical protein
MSLYDFEKSEFEKLNLFMQGIKSEETDDEKMTRYFNQWSFENTQSEDTYSDATSSSVNHRMLLYK